MAQVQRKRTLVNPRRRRNKARRKMSPKQIRHFGTKAQKAALKNSRRRRRNAGYGSVRKTKKRLRKSGWVGHSFISKARRTAGKTRSRARRRSRSNPGGLVEVALLNPAPRKRRKMAAHKTKKRRHTTKRRRRHVAHRNPAPRRHNRRRARHNRRHYRRHNPSLAGVGSLVTSAAYAIGGAVASKYLTQAVLGSSNSGFIGYGANLVASFAVGKIVGGMFLKNKQAESMLILGGVIQTVLRALVDMTPIGKKLQAGFSGMGDYQATTIFSPVRYLDPSKSAAVDLPASIQPRMAAAPAGGMSGLAVTRDTYSRGNSTY